VELCSAKEVADIVPSIDEIKNLDSRGLIVTGPAPAGSGYDFFTRFFCPKFGIDEVMSFLNPKLYSYGNFESCKLTISDHFLTKIYR
jgi:hypothetical protein